MWEWRNSEELCFQRKDIGRLSTQLRLSSEYCTSLEQQLTQVTQSKRKCQRRLSNYKSKWGRDVQAELGWIEEQLEECYRKIKLLTSENRELQQMVQFLDEDCDVVTFQEGKYTDNVREVYMKLLNMGVGRRNIQDVIRIILRFGSNVTFTSWWAWQMRQILLWGNLKDCHRMWHKTNGGRLRE